MHKSTVVCIRTALRAVLCCLLLFGACREIVAADPCTNVATRFVGVPATNCVLPPLSLQLTNPVCEVTDDGFPISYFKVTLTNVPPGYSVTNGMYRGWCVDYDGAMASGTQYKPIMYLSTAPLPPHLVHTNWDMVNYILNHKQGNSIDVQAAIWRFIGGPVPSSDPVFFRLSAAGSNMVNEARAFGEGFVPGPGEITALILDLGTQFQLNIIEVVCPGILEICPGGNITLCTTNRGTAPLSIMWLKNGAMIPGANGACLSLTNLSASDSAVYCIKVTNACSAVTNCVTIIVTNTSDSIPPMIVCASNRTYQCLALVPPSPDLGSVTASDNSGSVTVTLFSEMITTNGCDILVTRRYKAADACGNMSFCERTDLVRDTTPPVLVGVPANATYQCISNVPALPVVAAIDNCDSNLQVLVTSTTMGTCPQIIETRWSALDRCGNGVTNVQIVTVLDTVPPLLTCPPDITVPTVNMIPPCFTTLAQFRTAGGVASDNCDAVLDYRCTDGPLVGGDCGGFLLRTHTAIDDCTNVTSCIQRINIASNLPPVITCPASIQVQCSNSIPPCPGSQAQFLAAGGSVTGSNLTYACSDGPLTGGICGGSIVRTHSVTDACGAVVSCQQTITIRDTVPPVLVCPPSLTIECGSAWEFTAPTATDNCGLTNVAITIVSTTTNQLCGNTYSATRTWRATDQCTNSSTCSQTVTLVDTQPPLISCGIDFAVECGTTWIFTPPTGVDACDGTNVSIVALGTVTNNLCGRTFTTTRTYKATDGCGNMSTNSQSITVVDTTPPQLVCGAARAVECGTTWTFDRPVVSDNCDGTNVNVRIVSTVTNAMCGRTFTAIRIWEAVDSCTNRSTCSQVVVVADTTPPELVCAANKTVECGSTWTFDAPAANDICGGTNVSIAVVSTVTNRTGFCGNTYQAIRLWRATDACTNSATCSQIVTIVDITPPTLVCAVDQVVECGSSSMFTAPSANDLCDGTNVAITVLNTVTNQSGLCGRSFTATRTWRATDSCSNSATCSQTVTVVDTTPPELVCASARTVECGTAWTFDGPAGTDLCDGTNVVIIVVSTTTNRMGFCGETFSATRIWRATDACSNSTSCSQTVTVVDTTPPVFTAVPGDETYQCLADVPSMPMVSASDLCGGTNVSVTAISSISPNGCGFLISQSWTATDQCSNSVTRSRTVTVRDTVAPVLACAAAKTAECGSAWTFDAPSVADNCDTNPTVLVLSTVTNRVGFCGNTFSATRTWEATDDCTNRASCSQTVTVVDTTPPSLVCAPNQTADCGRFWTFTVPSANDLCDGTNVAITVVSTVTNRTGFCGSTFTATRTWRATDSCSNSATCSQTISSVDVTPPELVCAGNRIVECGGTWTFDRPAGNDLCDGTNVAIAVVSTITNRTGFCGNTFEAVRTWSATDSCSNSATCSQTITVVDTTAPELVCGAARTVECGTLWSFDAPSASDLCDGTNVTLAIVSTTTNTTGFCGGTFSATRTWRATDSCSNSAVCSQTITLVDTIAPVLLGVPGNETYQCLGDVPAMPVVSASDLCAGTNVLVTAISSIATDGCGFLISQSWTATDACSNTVTRSRTLTIRDLAPPVLNCAANKTAECGSAWVFDAPSAADNCDTNPMVRIVSTVTNRAGFCGNTFSATRTWEAIDACTNRSTCSQTVLVVDTTPPDLICGEPRTVECGTTWDFDMPTATDLCSGTNVTIVVVSTVTNRVGFCGGTFQATRTWRATDECTNATTLSQTITLVDTLPPVLLGVPGDMTVQCLADAPTMPVVSATDLCGGTNVTLTAISSIAANGCGYLISQSWTATDECSNSVTRSRTITVRDTIAPVFNCAEFKTAECGVNWSFDFPSVVDNCDTNVEVRILSTETNRSGFCGGAFRATRTWEAIDDCTNRTTCMQTVLVFDTTAPDLVCGKDKTVECSTVWNFDMPAAFDLCVGTNVSLRVVSTVTNAGVCPTKFSVTRTWEASDQCANLSTCSQTVTVVDTIPPEMTCGPNQTVECGTTWTFSTPNAWDICDGTNITLRILSTTTNAGVCPQKFSVVRTWEALDSCSNRASCSQTISVIDTTPPLLVCAPTLIVECGTAWSFEAPAVNDLCDGTNVTVRMVGTVTNGLCGSTFTATRTWEAVDACNNTSRCSQVVSVLDTLPPSLSCWPDQAIECGTPWAFIPPLAFDLCAGTNVSLRIVSTITNSAGPCSFTATRIWEAVDACTNVARCSQTITVTDTLPPELACASPKTVECGATWTFDRPAATDLCDGTNVTIIVVNTTTNRAGFCGNTFAATRTWRARDSCSNTVTCSQTVTVVDTLPPDLVCGKAKTIECGVIWDFDMPAANDICGGTNVTIVVVSTVTNRLGFCGSTFEATRMWTATDSCSNSATCSQTVTVVDTTPPVLLNVPGNETYQCLADVPATPVVTASDLCEGTNVALTASSSIAMNGCDFLISQSWTATDACSNSVTRSRTITVRDTIPPVLNCAGSKIVECGTVWGFDAPSVADNCDTNPVVTILSTTTNRVGYCGGAFSATRTWEAVDDCTNRTVCSQTVMVIDTLPPELVCGAARTFECGAVWSFDRPSAFDLCDGTNVVVTITSTTTNAGICPIKFTATRTWEAVDQCTNRVTCSQTITVLDTTPPALVCGTARAVECGTAWTFDPPSANDNCDGTNIAVVIVSTETNRAGFCGNTFSATRTWRATDQCTNASACSQTITVVDTTPPELVCGSAKVVECGTAWSFDAPSGSDLCDGTNIAIVIVSTVTNRVGFCGDTFSATRTWRATDSCSNAVTCSQTVMLIDTLPPLLLGVPGNETFQCLGDVPATPVVTASDLCDGTNVMLTAISSIATNGCGYVISQSWTATDRCSNSATRSRTITVRDTIPPSLTCATNFTADCGSTWVFTPPAGFDNCEGTNISVRIVGTETNFGGFCGFTFSATRTWEAVDSCTNISRCSQTVTVRDVTPPTIVCATNVIVECGAAWDFSRPSAFDLCDGTNVAISISGTITNPLCGRTFTATRTWKAMDSCSNMATCSQTVTLVDTTPPILSMGTNFFVECGSPWVFGTPTASDACSTNVDIVILSTSTNALCGRTFSATRTWRATDACGNSTTNSQMVTVIDTMPPMLVCAPDRVVECGGAWGFDLPAASDLCDTNVAVTVFNTVTNPLCGATFRATRTWKATDACGNMTFCNQNIVVVDTTAPVLVGVPPSTNYPCLISLPPVAVVTATDVCDASLVVTRVSTTNGVCPTIIVHTWTATDDCSNTVSAVQVITVQEEPPVITRAPMNTLVCQGSNATFCVEATSPCPLTYQWSRGKLPIPGATNSCLTISNATPADAGQYCVTVSSPCESRLACATLTVLTNISIGPVPALPCLVVGTNLTLCPPILGSGPFTCAWYKDGVRLANQPTCCLELPFVLPNDGGTYTLYVTGLCNVASADYIVPVPTIQCNPTGCEDQTVCVEGSFFICETNFVMFPGVNYGFQWYLMTGTSSNLLVGQTNQCLLRTNVTAADAGFYGVIVTASVGNTTVTQLFCGGTIQVPVNPVNRPLANHTVCPGATVEFCTDSGPTNSPFTFEWRRNNLVLAGETNNCLLVTNVSLADAGQYCVIVSSLAGITNRIINTNVTPSSNVCGMVINCGNLTVLTNILLAGPTNVTTCPGLPVQLCANASGTGPFTYRWLKDGVALPNQTNACVNIPAAESQHAGMYCVEVTSPNACSGATNCAVLTVLTNTTATPLANVITCPGSNVTFSTVASGTGPFTFMWFRDGAMIPGAAGSAITLTNVDSGAMGTYCVKVTGACNSVTNCGTLTIRNNLQLAGPTNQTVCPGLPITLCVTPSGAAGPFTFRWTKNGALIPNQTNACLVIPSAASTDAGTYCAEVSSPNACMPATNCAVVTVLTNTTATPLVNVTVCAGSNVTFSTLASGSGPFTYMWFREGVMVPGATGSSLTVTNAQTANAGEYCVKVTGACNSVTNCATLTVLNNLQLAGPTNQTVCPGQPITLCVTPSGASGPFTFRWTKNGMPVPNATNACLLIASAVAADSGTYCAEVSSPNACMSATNCAIVTVLTNTTAPPLGDIIACAGSNVTFSTVASGTGPFTYMWFLNGAMLPGASGSTLTVTNVRPQDAGQFCVKVTGACNSVTNCANLTVRTNLIAQGPTNQTVCPGSPAALCVTASGSGPFSYVWRKGGVLLVGETNSCLNIVAATSLNAGQYCVEVSSPNACNIVTNCALVTVLTSTTATPLANVTVCPGSNAAFSTVASGTGPFTYMWFLDGVMIPNATGPTLTVANVTPADAGEYCVKVTGACNSVTNCARLTVAAALGDFVWEDVDGDGRQDAGEPGIAGVTVRLMGCASNVIATTTTDGSGFYLFTCLAPGSYRVQFVAPGGFEFTQRDIGSDDLDSDASAGSGITTNCYVLGSGETNRTADAGLVRRGAIGDFVWEDMNMNGRQDVGEPGLSNVPVHLIDCSTLTTLRTTNTTAAGFYLFADLLPGEYKVTFIPPAGYAFTIPNAMGVPDNLDSDALPGTGMTACYSLASGEINLTVDAGLFRSTAIGDFVWEDLNRNGRQDAGELGISNVLVQLQDCVSMTVLRTTNTDVNGAYLFANLTPGSYKVTFGQPAGYTFTTQDAAGVPDNLDSDANPVNGMTGCYTLMSGEVNLTVDAGLYRPACLGDFVWEDLNGNGRQDMGEPGISNVTLRLIDCATSNLLSTTTTGPNGEYLFCGLVPGSYRVEIVLPGGFTISVQNAGADDCVDSDAHPMTRLTDCVVLVSGETNRCTDIGLKRPAALGDFVWEDLNFNGRQDGGEPGVSNVVVQLLDCTTMNLIGMAVTDANGLYLFPGLLPGSYKITFTPPAGYFFTLPNAAGVPDDRDSDADLGTGMTGCYTLVSGQTNLTVDAGLIRPVCLGDFVWEDLNFNGRQDAGEPGITNVTLRLIDCATTNIIATTTTGPNGQYLFCDLVPGTYRVEIVVPGGYTITVPDSGANDCRDSDANPATRLTDCVVLVSGTDNRCVDIGLKRFSAIGDFVWNDTNMNGRQDAGELGISNVTVRLTDCATMSVIATTATDSGGRYLFSGLTGGTYKVTFVAPPGYQFSPRDAAGVPDDLDSDADPISGMTICYTLPPGTTNLTVDAGLYVPLRPCIDVTKTVACLLPGDQCGPFGKAATGYRAGTNNPAFCYSITISNCGGHTLTNVSVIDNRLGNLTTNFFASPNTPFPPFTAITRFYKMAWDVDTTNTATATARAAAAGAQQVSDNDLAVAFVDNASVSCQTIVYSPDDQDTSFTDGHVTLVDDGQAHEVTFIVIICNNGDVDLANVRINTPGLASLACAAPAPFDLPVGACRTNILCMSRLMCASLPLSLTNFVTAVVDTRNNACGYDINGSNITARTDCIMEVECGLPGSCRVTGGGRQHTFYPDNVRYVTHGGQVGAPVGSAGFDPGTCEREGSECIHGNWEHVRHEKAGNRGNFHAKIYDSLMCACLGCPEDPTAGAVVGGLCNPDNRICGPEPRRAPANKICFSGIGDYTHTSGNREPRSVLFRVDIEDRSEPGNSHAGGSQAPHDRHRIRIWILTDAEKARLNNPLDRLLDFRQAISCSPGSTALQDGAVGADGKAVPLGTAVFGVRAPDIDDGGEMDHGNHQIHPMIKDCPK